MDPLVRTVSDQLCMLSLPDTGCAALLCVPERGLASKGRLGGGLKWMDEESSMLTMLCADSDADEFLMVMRTSGHGMPAGRAASVANSRRVTFDQVSLDAVSPHNGDRVSWKGEQKWRKENDSHGSTASSVFQVDSDHPWRSSKTTWVEWWKSREQHGDIVKQNMVLNGMDGQPLPTQQQVSMKIPPPHMRAKRTAPEADDGSEVVSQGGRSVRRNGSSAGALNGRERRKEGDSWEVRSEGAHKTVIAFTVNGVTGPEEDVAKRTSRYANTLLNQLHQSVSPGGSKSPRSSPGSTRVNPRPGGDAEEHLPAARHSVAGFVSPLPSREPPASERLGEKKLQDFGEDQRRLGRIRGQLVHEWNGKTPRQLSDVEYLKNDTRHDSKCTVPQDRTRVRHVNTFEEVRDHVYDHGGHLALVKREIKLWDQYRKNYAIANRTQPQNTLTKAKTGNNLSRSDYRIVSPVGGRLYHPAEDCLFTRGGYKNYVFAHTPVTG